MRVLFYGAGVIGSLYAAKFSNSGVDTCILARGRRLEELKKNGVRIRSLKNKNVEEFQKIHIIEDLLPEDKYDFIFVTMQRNQVDDILPILQRNNSSNIVFMVNNSSGPEKWINSVGDGRVLIAFPGAGGKREDGMVHYHIVSRFIQPTTIGEINGKITERVRKLYKLFNDAGFPVSISKNIVGWQISHIAMVCPMANSIYMDGGNNYSTSKNSEAIKLMTMALKESFKFLEERKLGIYPYKLRIFLLCPNSILNIFMRLIYNTRWAETVISSHANVAREEMKMLSRDFISLSEEHNFDIKYFKKLASYC